MTPRPIRTLIEQVFAFNPQRDVLVSVAVWSGFAADRQALVICRNGTATGKVIEPAAVIAARYAEAIAPLAGYHVDEATARRELARITGFGQLACLGGDCGADLPIGAPWCPTCGRSQGRAASGMLTGARRRGDIHLHVRTGGGTE